MNTNYVQSNKTIQTLLATNLRHFFNFNFFFQGYVAVYRWFVYCN